MKEVTDNIDNGNDEEEVVSQQTEDSGVEVSEPDEPEAEELEPKNAGVGDTQPTKPSSPLRIHPYVIIILCVLAGALLLFLAFTLGRNSGDADSPAPNGDTPVTASPTPEDSSDDHIHGIDFEQAILTFAPDTVMIKADDLIVTWADLYFPLFSAVANLSQMFPDGIDWDEEIEPGINFADLILEQATEEALSLLVIEYGANTLGVTLGGEALDMLNADIDGLVEMYGGIEELEKALRELGGFYSFELFERVVTLDVTMSLIMEALYGTNASLLADEKAADYTQRNGYLTAKHILRVKTEDGDDTPLLESEAILAQLNERIDDEDFESFFDEMIAEHSEDPGSFTFPQGYLFQPHEMVPAFSEATASLLPGELSGIVETDFGYHIILRVSTDFDRTPYAMESAGMTRSLRQLAAIEDFEIKRQEWRDGLNIVFTPEYYAIDISSVFAECTH